MKFTRMGLAATIVGIGLAAAACTGSTDDAATPPSSTAADAGTEGKSDNSSSVATIATNAPAPSSVPVAASEAPISFPELPKGAPDGFPVPSGAKVAPAGANGSFTVSGEGGEKVIRFYQAALPEAGYKILTDDASGITFEGKGIKGKIAASGDGVAVTLTK